jgi:hypothetical protein
VHHPDDLPHSWRVSSLLSLPIGLLAVFLFCIPGLLNGSPLMYPDTRSYFMGGRAAVDKVHAVVIHLLHLNALVDSPDALVQQARGVRSAYYSLFTYLLTIGGSVWAVIVVQAILCTWVIWMIHRTFLRADEVPVRMPKVLVAMTLLTSLPWTVSFMMPDIFTPLLVLTLGCVLIQWSVLHPGQRLALLLMAGLSIVMHITNLPMALGLTLLIVILQWRQFRARLAAYVAISGVMAGATVAMLIVGLVGFHEWSIQPQSPPFLTARSLDDGPGKLYLREHCPQLNFVLCRYLDRLDVGADDFIWHANGVYSAVSPEDQAQMRREDKRLYFLAAAEHPLMQISAIAQDTVDQLLSFTLHDSRVPSFAQFKDGDMKLTVPESFPPWLVALSVIDYIAVVAACLILRFLWVFGRLTPPAKTLILVVSVAVVLNAFAGAMSMPAPRYEARIIWLLPLMAAIFWRLSPAELSIEGVAA